MNETDHDAGRGIEARIEEALVARRGHFVLESGHHGELWLELERLYSDPGSMATIAAALAERIRPWEAEVVCGPLVEGAFLALQVAERLGVAYAYSERGAPEARELFPYGYRVPDPLRAGLGGKRVVVVNDVFNAGSAVKGTVRDLHEVGARIHGLGCMLTLGAEADRYAAEAGLALETLASWPNELWAPEACPLCARGVPWDPTPFVR